ncbi:MAG: fimbrial protein [Candidatus Cryptobacteroides sp.]
MRDTVKYGIMVLTLLCTLACNREVQPDIPQDGTGNLVVNIGSGTKAGTASDGDLMNNLHVWLVDNTDKVVRYVSWTGTDTEQVKMNAGTTATVTITNLNRGTYNIYIVANAPSGLTLPAVDETLGDDTFKKFVLTLPVGDSHPDLTGGMPLTLKTTTPVNPGKNVVKAELVRVCGRIRVSVRNHTADKRLYINSIILGAKNPDRGYLFQQDGHAVPDGISYGEFESRQFAEGQEVKDSVGAGQMVTFVDQYIFETGLNAFDDLSLSFAGGVFERPAPGSVLSPEVISTQKDVYTPQAEFSGFYSVNLTKGDYFIIRNSGANYFLRSNGTGMKQYFFNSVDELLASDDPERYFWTFEGASCISEGSYGASSVTGIKSVYESKTENKYINISTTDYDKVSLTSSSQSLTIGTQQWGMLIRNGNYKIYCSYTNGDDVKSKVNQADQTLVYWKMIPVTKGQQTVLSLYGAKKDFSKNISSIDYIDEFGVSVPLTDICRNEDVNIIINVFYNPEYLALYFEVSGWTSVSNETTFD